MVAPAGLRRRFSRTAPPPRPAPGLTGRRDSPVARPGPAGTARSARAVPLSPFPTQPPLREPYPTPTPRRVRASPPPAPPAPPALSVRMLIHPDQHGGDQREHVRLHERHNELQQHDAQHQRRRADRDGPAP